MDRERERGGEGERQAGRHEDRQSVELRKDRTG